MKLRKILFQIQLFKTAGKVKIKKANLFIFQDINLNDLEAQ